MSELYVLPLKLVSEHASLGSEANLVQADKRSTSAALGTQQTRDHPATLAAEPVSHVVGIERCSRSELDK